jgi:hypothetical protein
LPYWLANFCHDRIIVGQDQSKEPNFDFLLLLQYIKNKTAFIDYSRIAFQIRVLNLRKDNPVIDNLFVEQCRSLIQNTHGEVNLLSEQMLDWGLASKWGMRDGATEQFEKLVKSRKIDVKDWHIKVLSREKWKETDQMVDFGGMPSWISSLTNEFTSWYDSRNEDKKITWSSFDSVVELKCYL